MGTSSMPPTTGSPEPDPQTTMQESTVTFPRLGRVAARQPRVATLVRGPHLPLALPTLLLACLGTLGCGGSSSSPKVPTNQPGTTVTDPDTGRLFIVDPSSGGSSTDVRVLRTAWGRLVDVFGFAADGTRRLMQEDFVIDPDLVSDGKNYLLETNAVTAQQSLTILRNVDDLATGAGLDQYVSLLIQAEANLKPVFDNGISGSGIFTMVPRNCTIVIQLDDLIDASTLDSTTLRVFTGTPSVIPFEARVLIDRNHGDLAGFSGQAKFYTTRLLIDVTVSIVESFETDPPLPVNSVGLPGSIDTNLSNVQYWIPTAIALDQDHLLTNPTGHSLTTVNNGSVNFGDPRLPVARAMRSGGSGASTGDPFNGFLRDQDPPFVVGMQEGAILSAPKVLNPPPLGDGTRFLIPTYQFISQFCAQSPAVGDIFSQPGLFAEVTEQPTPEQNGVVQNIKVRLLVWPKAWDEPGADGPLEWQTSGVGPAQFLSPYSPLDDVGQEGCFVRIVPSPTGFPENPNTGIFTSSNFSVRFSEPMDPGAMTAFDSMTLTRVKVPTASFEYVVGGIQQSIDLQEFSFIPDLPLAHEIGNQEPYWLTLVEGPLGPTDLAGNSLLDALPAIRNLVEVADGPQSNGGRVSRFSAVDEEFPFGTDGETLPEWAGQIVFNLERQTIRPRPVVRFEGVVDRTNALVGVMSGNINPNSAQTPLSNFGSKAQMIWRYVDMGFPLQDETFYNIDVEGLNWSPLGGQAVVDIYKLFEIRMNHGFYLPDEALCLGSPCYPNSGMVDIYENNFLSNLSDPQKVLHFRARGYTVNPGDIFTTNNGLKLLPFPLNRKSAPDQFTYYTWRDTSIQERAGPDGWGANPLQYYIATGEPPPITGDCAGTMFPPTPNPFYSPGNLQTIALPMLLEFRCFADDGAVGINRFDTSSANGTSNRPYFRAHSTGGKNTTFDTVIIDPDLETRANGGFDPNSTPSPGVATPGLDNIVYIGSVDFVTRVSRGFSVFFPAIDPSSGLNFPSPNYFPITIEPPVEKQPLGTDVQVSFRGANTIENEEAQFDADELDLYGDHYEEIVSLCDGSITHNPGSEFNADISFFNADQRWFDDASSISGATYYQIRLTFISNGATGLVPEVSAVALTWTE